MDFIEIAKKEIFCPELYGTESRTREIRENY